jgi:hypothetical protein
MIKISDKYSMSYKSGYFVTHKTGLTEAGKPTKVDKTYPSLGRAYEVLTDLGEDGNAVMIAGDKLLKLHGVVGRIETKARQVGKL